MRAKRTLNRKAERRDEPEKPRMIDPPNPARPKAGFHVSPGGRLMADRPSDGAVNASPEGCREAAEALKAYYARLLDQYRELVGQMSQAKYDLAQLRTDALAATYYRKLREAKPDQPKPKLPKWLMDQMADEAARTVYRDRGGSAVESANVQILKPPG